MIEGAPKRLERYGALAAAPDREGRPDCLVGGVPIHEMLAPYLQREVRLRVWTGAFEPEVSMAGRVGWDDFVHRVDLMGHPRGWLPIWRLFERGGQGHLEVLDLAEKGHADVLTLCYEMRGVEDSRKLRPASGGRGQRPKDFLQKGFNDRVPKSWDGARVRLMRAPGGHAWEAWLALVGDTFYLDREGQGRERVHLLAALDSMLHQDVHPRTELTAGAFSLRRLS